MMLPLHKYRVLIVIVGFVLILTGCATSSPLPEGTIKEGTLTNEKLEADMSVGLYAKVATLGCELKNLTDIYPYVLEMPAGEIGSRYWRELWIVHGCKNKYNVEVFFQEKGTGAANWVIE